MKRNRLSFGIVIAAIAIAIGYGLYSLGAKRAATVSHVPSTATPTSAAPKPVPQTVAEGEAATRRHLANNLKAGDLDPDFARRILYYQDPMNPGQRFDKPGKSPFMDMMLVPVYADADADRGTVTVSPRMQQNLGVRTAPVVEALLSPQVSAVGAIAYNERDLAVVQARANGFVERLHVRASLDRVAAGQPLVDLYVPDWIAAQEEYLAVRRMQGSDLGALVDGARQRMRQVGMSEQQIGLVETTGQPQPRITLTAPIGGVIVELAVREGMTVATGTTLVRINGLSTVWANAEVAESQAALVRPGSRVEAQTAAFPGTTFSGKVQSILPDVNPVTRTLKARIELANPGARLVPGMFASMRFTDARSTKVLQVPTEAVIQTGRRTVVMVAEDGGRFRPVGVEIGIETGGRTEIRRGLEVGQHVVVSSQFLIDSEASLRGFEARAGDAPHAAHDGSKP
ncbi:MAG: efflux RND transporter periplasmic adaptor subunit [Burkholderiales bacterium]|jgi:membrane fusion protein, copper/silver efflux system|nr:efflux RND transporter periplasmic adaptor subunit [Burkholderiales bacterium]